MATAARAAMADEKKDDGDHSFADVVGRGRQLPQSPDDDDDDDNDDNDDNNGKRARPTRDDEDGAAPPRASNDGGVVGASSGAVEGRRRSGGKEGNVNGNNPLLLLVCAAGITSCYMWYGMVQEHVFHLDGKDGGASESITLFLLATGTFSSFLLAWAWTILGPNAGGGGGGGGLDHPLIALTSLAYLSAMSASNESLHYVAYPTCVLAKSSKLVPTMIAGWVADRWGGPGDARCRRRRVDPTECVGAGLITAGIVSFQYVQLLRKQSNDRHDAGRDVGGDSPYGLALLGLSLLMDGVMAACQNALKRGRSGRRGEGKADDDGGGGGVLPTSSSHRRPPSAMETMLYINLYATLMLLPASYYAGQFRRGMDAMFSEGKSALLLQLNLSASLGQVFIFLTVHHFSPLTCTTITTTRKFFTILLSVYKFGHVLGAVQWLSVALVFAGLYLEIVAKLFEGGGGGGGRDRAVVNNHKERCDFTAEERMKKRKEE